MTEQPDGHGSLSQLLSTLTPERLWQTVTRLGRSEPPGEVGLRLDAVMADLLGGQSLGDGAEGWRNTIKLKRAIAALASEMPGLRYIEGDA